MKQSLIILFSMLIFALVAMARPQSQFNGFGGKFGGKKGRKGNNNNNNNNNNNANNATAANNSTAAANATAAADTGNNANFNNIAQDGAPLNNPCDSGKFPPTNGQQFKTPGTNSCSNTQQGEIPDVNHMVSTLILNPQDGQTMPANQNFTVAVLTQGMNLGFFDNPDTQYYSFSQQLDKQGNIMGHQHVTIQQITNPNQPLDPKSFAFFKGLNDATNNGVLTVAVPNGLPAGNYRLCTMTGAFGHQPVIMPVAQRGAQDDCVRFKCK